MKVTVIEQVEHSADITPEMIEAYLVRNGWDRLWDGPSTRGYEFNDRWRVVIPVNGRGCSAPGLDTTVTAIARRECRHPWLVLADIARGT